MIETRHGFQGWWPRLWSFHAPFSLQCFNPKHWRSLLCPRSGGGGGGGHRQTGGDFSFSNWQILEKGEALMNTSNEAAFLWKWTSQSKGQSHGAIVDSSLIRKFPPDYFCPSRLLPPSVIADAALHEKEVLGQSTDLIPFEMQNTMFYAATRWMRLPVLFCVPVFGSATKSAH